MSTFWLVEVEPWVTTHPVLRQDTWNTIKEITGVVRLTDVAAISLPTLEQWMLPRQLSLIPQNRKGK